MCQLSEIYVSRYNDVSVIHQRSVCVRFRDVSVLEMCPCNYRDESVVEMCPL